MNNGEYSGQIRYMEYSNFKYLVLDKLQEHEKTEAKGLHDSGDLGFYYVLPISEKHPCYMEVSILSEMYVGGTLREWKRYT
jgi:hypothetical protein